MVVVVVVVIEAVVVPVAVGAVLLVAVAAPVVSVMAPLHGNFGTGQPPPRSTKSKDREGENQLATEKTRDEPAKFPPRVNRASQLSQWVPGPQAAPIRASAQLLLNLLTVAPQGPHSQQPHTRQWLVSPLLKLWQLAHCHTVPGAHSPPPSAIQRRKVFALRWK